MAINVDRSRALQDKGVWTKFGGSHFKVAHSSASRFQRALNRLQAPHRRKIEKGNLDPEISREILCEAMAEGLLLDWRDVEDRDGNPVQYDSEVGAKALLNNDDLREYLQEFAMDMENFRGEEIKEEGKP